MKTDTNDLCCGCLCKDRKTSPISDYLKKECLSQIIGELSDTEESSVLRFCWQCEAYARNFVKFKKQVKKSYLSLIDIHNETLPTCAYASLTITNILELSLTPDNQSQDESFQVLNSNPPIKEEYFDNPTYSDSDDNQMLIEIKKKKVKKEVGNKQKSFYGNDKVVIEIKKKKCKKEIGKQKRFYTEVELNDAEILEERKYVEKSDDYVNAMFRCDKCLTTFPNEDDLTEHKHKKHELHSKHKCWICECTFSSEMSYSYHRSRHRRRYQCTACNNNSGTKRAAVKHYEMVHCHSETYELEKLQYDNKYKTNEQVEINGSKSEENYPCEVCDKRFRWKTSLRKHMETHKIEAGQKRKPYCEPCRLSFTTTSNLQKHVKTSSKHQIQLKLRKLLDSNPDPLNTQALSQQVSNIKVSVNSSRELYSCPQCERRFQWRGNMLRHLHTHTSRANGELVCKPCNRKFSSIATYKQHMQISKKHATENDFKYMCSDCGKRFANKTKLKDHVDWEHLKNYVHTCNDCQKIFKSHTSLYLHRQVVHKKTNAEHLCDHCGKSFPNRSKLYVHMSGVHAGSRLVCGACPARFSWASCLSRHVRRRHRDGHGIDTGGDVNPVAL